jgi:biopolymer transport protein ExbB/TolQ
MSAEYFIIGILLFLLLASHVYWPIVFFKFLDRFMARNYAEFAQSKNLMKQNNKASLQSPPEDEIDPHAERNAEALNSLIGAV